METPLEFYNLADRSGGIRRELAPGLSARIFTGDRVMLSIVTVQPGAEGRLHSHPEEQWGVLLEGEGVRLQGGEEVPVKAGDFWRTPGGVYLAFRAASAGARFLDIFSPPREGF